MARDKDQLLQIELGDRETFDVIKLDDLTVMFVISERGPVQKRFVAVVGADDAIRIAKFLVGIKGDSDAE